MVLKVILLMVIKLHYLNIEIKKLDSHPACCTEINSKLLGNAK